MPPNVVGYKSFDPYKALSQPSGDLTDAKSALAKCGQPKGFSTTIGYRSDRPRALYICVYSAADAVPLARNPLANPNEGLIVRGKATRFARLMDGPIELPEQPKSASFFAVQGQKSAGKAAE